MFVFESIILTHEVVLMYKTVKFIIILLNHSKSTTQKKKINK